VEAYQLISGVYVKALHERTKDMRAAMCTCITYTHTCARVSRFTHYYLVTCDDARSRGGMVCLMSSLFLSCVFYWLTLPHLDCHVNHDWLHVERFQGGGSWNLGRSNLRWTGSFNIYRRRPVYRNPLTVHSTL
jgi:hypothetical protein